MRKLVILFTSVILLFGLVLAQSQFGNRGSKSGGRGIAQGERGRFAERGIAVVTDYLGLDSNQVENLNSLIENRKTATKTVLVSIKEDGSALRDLMESGNPDPTAVGNRVISMHNQRQEIGNIQSIFVADFKAMLTAEQLTLYEEVVAKSGRDRVNPAFRSLGLFEGPGFNDRNRRSMGRRFGSGFGPEGF